jgi:Zn-dependent protease with chaperone function
MHELFCPNCKTTVSKKEQICQNCGVFLVEKKSRVQQTDIFDVHAPVSYIINDYVLSLDLVACEVIKRIPILPQAIELLITHWSKPMERAKLLGNGVRADFDQLPSIYNIMTSTADRLGIIKYPEIFITSDPTINAYTIGSNDDHIIVITSGLIDVLLPDELAFVIGHELGHIKSQHVTYLTIGRLIANGISSFISPLFLPLTIPLGSWSRQAELTADRAGALACHNPEASIRALLLSALGTRSLLPEFNLKVYLRQEQDLNNFYGHLHHLLENAEHPETVTRVRCLLDFIFSSSGQALSKRMDVSQREANAISRIPSDSKIRLNENYEKSATPVIQFCSGCGFEIENNISQCAICGASVRS